MVARQEKLPSGNEIGKAKELGLIVRKARKEAKLTQAKAAGMCNVGTRFLSDLENGKATVELGKVLQVLRGFGLTVTVSQRKFPKTISEISHG